jgi:hypothetical protein
MVRHFVVVPFSEKRKENKAKHPSCGPEFPDELETLPRRKQAYQPSALQLRGESSHSSGNKLFQVAQLQNAPMCASCKPSTPLLTIKGSCCETGIDAIIDSRGAVLTATLLPSAKVSACTASPP